MIIDLHVPTRVVFGRGRLAELGERTARLGGTALVVCGRTAARTTGLLDAATTVLAEAGVTTVVFDQVSPDPQSTQVDDAVAVAQRERCDVVIGLGGGSAIDAAKATAVGMRHGPVGPLIGTTVSGSDAVPVVAVPTTAGSGAEVTKGAIVTDTTRNLKSGIRGDILFPHTAIIDPRVLVTVPPEVAAETGFDAVCHAVEGYVARRSSVITRLYSVHALELLAAQLPRIVAGDTSEGVLDDLALAALLGGLNVANASSCLPHRLQQAMGSVPAVRVSHGRGLAAVYPEWTRRAYPFAREGFDAIASTLGSSDVHAALSGLMATIGVRAGLKDVGFTETDVDDLVGGVTGNTENDPMPGIDDELIRDIYLASF
jgi:alcohol dehydrogenase class IV